MLIWTFRRLEELHWSKGKESKASAQFMRKLLAGLGVASKRSAGKTLWFSVTRHSSPLALTAKAGIRKSLSTVCCISGWQMSRCLQGRACLLMSLGQDWIAQLCRVAKKGKAVFDVMIYHRILALLCLSTSDPVSVCPLPNSSSPKTVLCGKYRRQGKRETWWVKNRVNFLLHS